MRRRYLPIQLLLLSIAPIASQDAPTDVPQICLAPASVEAAPSGSDPGAAVRETFTSFLTGPTLGVKPLDARLESQVRQEAKLAGCTYLLLPTVKHQRKTGGGLLGRVAAAGAARTAAWDYSSTFRSKDELTLGWRPEGPNGAELRKGKTKKKAGSDGEDLLTRWCRAPPRRSPPPSRIAEPCDLEDDVGLGGMHAPYVA